MSRPYRTLSASEARAFLAEQGQRKVGPHSLTKRIAAWMYCARCGLVDLNNEVTRRAMRAQCVVFE